MTTLKILSSDNLVIVNGEALQIDVSGVLNDDIWAVSFDGSVGEVEFTDPARNNETLNHIGDYQTIIELHAVALAQAVALEAELQAKNDAAQQALALKMTGFKYGEFDVSYTREDRAAVLEANQAFDKKTPLGEYYIPDDVPLTISFSNGTRLPLSREQFENEFFPQFFAQAVTEFM